MFQKIKRGFGIFFSTLWISMFTILMANDRSDGINGLQVNGFVAFLVWIIFMFIMIKISILLADIALPIIYIILETAKFGADQGLVDAFTGIAMIIVLCVLFYKLIAGSAKTKAINLADKSGMLVRTKVRKREHKEIRSL